MSKRILFEELVARREQREADKLKIGELRIPDSDRTLEAKMPPKKAVLELYGELAAAQDAAAALQCGNHALYAVCPQLQDRDLQREIGTAEDPMRTVDALFSLMEQDKLGGQALQFLGLLPGDSAGSEESAENAAETVKKLIARDPILSLFAFYAARGVPLDALAAASPTEIGFLMGARALYFDEQVALTAAAIDQSLTGGEKRG